MKTMPALLAVALATIFLGGCTLGSGPTTSLDAPTGAPPDSSHPSVPLSSPGRGWDDAGLQGPVPGRGSCRYRRAADAFYLPDPACTPGAVDPTVTQSDLEATICRSGGYTSSVRPPESMTEPFKKKVELAYADPWSGSRTELDHLVPLELGGSSDTRNLWPEPDQGEPAEFDPQDPFGANAKDGVEDRLHEAVCSGRVSLVAAQTAMVGDWTTAMARLGISA